MTTESEDLTSGISAQELASGTAELSTAHAMPEDAPGTRPASARPEQDTVSSEAPEREPAARPVDGLVRTAVTTRSVPEIVDLIRLLEQSPSGVEAAEEILRTAAVERPVDDVSDLVALLSRPPQPVERADEAIHLAAAERSIDDVSDLVALLHRPPHDSHAGEEAVHAAATGLTVEELAELIDRLETERAARAETGTTPPPDALLAQPSEEEPTGSPLPDGDSMSTAHTEGTATVAGTTEAPTMDAPTARPTPSLTDGRRRPPSRSRQMPEASTGDRQAEPAAALPLWLRWTTAATLLLCGVTHFPFQRTGLPASVYGLAVGIAVLCLLLAAGTLLRRVLPVLIADILLMGSLTAAHLLAPATGPQALTSALEPGGTPAVLLAAVAGVLSLLALTLLLTRGRSHKGGATEPTAGSQNLRARPDLR
ncbi:hypothetical protein [Streptomyces albidoflavus]|uniref:hypothetical protein n=1 Tax=Streptomyces albidoflavus TaxID=1886 RepID=UPI00340256BE